MAAWTIQALVDVFAKVLVDRVNLESRSAFAFIAYFSIFASMGTKIRHLITFVDLTGLLVTPITAVVMSIAQQAACDANSALTAEQLRSSADQRGILAQLDVFVRSIFAVVVNVAG